MKLSTDWLNTLSYEERYAWFFESNSPAVNVGVMTDVGTYWNNVVSPVSFPTNIE